MKMSRRKQAKPRALKHESSNESGDATGSVLSMSEDKENLSHTDGDDAAEDESGFKIEFSNNDDSSMDSICTDLFSSNESTSYSLSVSDTDAGQALSFSSNTEFDAEKNDVHKIRTQFCDSPQPKPQHDSDQNALKHRKNHGNNPNGGNYSCQFCDKIFPRLGYLKKHEQSHTDHMPFQCEYCKRLFKHKRSRDRHTKLHTGDRRYRCYHCEAAFSRSDHLKIHMKTHDNNKAFKCTFTMCNRGYNTAAALTSHMQNHKKQLALTGSPTLTYTSRYSPRSTGSGSSINSLNLASKRRPDSLENAAKSPSQYLNYAKSCSLTCLYCTKTDFSSLDQLHSHIQNMHKVNAQKLSALSESQSMISCEFCTIKCSSFQSLVHHLRTIHTTQKSKIPLETNSSPLLSSPGLRVQNGQDSTNCLIKEENKTSDSPGLAKEPDDREDQSSPTDLSQHRNKKSKFNEKLATERNEPETFLCNQCTAAFPDFELFRNHLKSHLQQDVSNYYCQTCGCSSVDQKEYEKHITSHYLITVTEYSCVSQCGKTFQTSGDLQKHLVEEHLQSIFKCSLCAEIFDTQVAVQMHFAVKHTSEMLTFRCTSCTESFTQEADFRSHIRSKHINQGNVQCVFCQFVCSSELEMQFHLSSHAKQYKCPSCSESFHIEFLLDKHLQAHHSQKETTVLVAEKSVDNNNSLDAHNRYCASILSKSPYHQFCSKYYQPLQMAISPVKQPPNGIFNDLYGSISKSYRFIDGQCNPVTPEKLNLFVFPKFDPLSDKFSLHEKERMFSDSFNRYQARPHEIPNLFDSNSSAVSEKKMFSCGICDRKDFSTESEANTHRKISHNIKTGVSLRCAYCSGDFRSRTELENHMKTAHNTTGKHKCLICDEILPSQAVLAEHKLTHCKVGNSGKCSYCLVNVVDLASFKAHLMEHNGQEVPIQCICCRQTLQTEFEIGLHARFHTRTNESTEKHCAFCLQTIPISSGNHQKVCENCYKKHNFLSKNNSQSKEETHIECNLCKRLLPNDEKLKEHLVEHTFAGCEDRGYNCFICSSVFTSPANLILHIQSHENSSMPYDCGQCSKKFFFRAELENHVFEHIENKGPSLTIKSENTNKTKTEEEDEEYIEVEDKSEFDKPSDNSD